MASVFDTISGSLKSMSAPGGLFGQISGTVNQVANMASQIYTAKTNLAMMRASNANQLAQLQMQTAQAQAAAQAASQPSATLLDQAASMFSSPGSSASASPAPSAQAGSSTMLLIGGGLLLAFLVLRK